MGEAREPPGVAEVREPSPTITTGGSRLAVVAAAFLAGLVEGSAVSLRFFGLLATSAAVPEVIKSETLVTAKY